MRFTEIASRLNGITLGPIGAQWVAKPTDVGTAQRVIRFLEDRRILYNDCAWEEPNHCVESVLEIRKFLTQELLDLGNESDALGALRTMRAACRKFLDRMHQKDFRRVRLDHSHDAFDFYSTPGEFRGAIGPQVALLAVYFRIDVEGELAKTLPIEASNTSVHI